MRSESVIWDRQTRLIHWLLAITIILNLFMLEEGDPPHQWVGYAAAGFVFCRLLWGFFGGPQSRFAAFPIGVSQIKQFVRSQISNRPIDYPGHNPLAAIVYILIWVTVLCLGVTGFMMELDAYWGEEWLEDLHGNLSVAMQVFVASHLIGLALDSYKFKRRTWMGMISGRRR